MAGGTGISGVGVAVVLAGSVLLYAGLKGKSPAESFRALLLGTNPAVTPTTNPIGGTSSAASGNTTFDPATTGAGGTVTKNKAIARLLAAPYGWSTGQQWAALDALWTRESGWSTTAANPSGAYGIPQSLPANKMPAAALPPFNSATAQIAWGLAYIAQRYGDPITAEQHEQTAGWY